MIVQSWSFAIQLLRLRAVPSISARASRRIDMLSTRRIVWERILRTLNDVKFAVVGFGNLLN